MIINGIIDNIIFKNEDNGYTVLDVNWDDSLITCVGKFPSVVVGQRIEVNGQFVSNKYGEQFSAVDVKVLPPNTCEGIVKYLSSGLIKGIGPVTAQAIVDKFKEDTLYIIEFNSKKLEEVKGVSKEKAEKIAGAFLDLKKMQNAVMFLQTYDISTSMALRIYKVYGDKTEQILKVNPYKMIEDIDGIGFLSADKIAQKLGIAPDSDFRLRAGILYVLKETSDKNGSTYLTQKALFTETVKLLKLDEEKTKESFESLLNNLIFENFLVEFDEEDEKCVALKKFYSIEKSIAQKLLNLKNQFNQKFLNIDAEINDYERTNSIKFHSKQQEAITVAINSGVSVITGGPGTGKTTIVKCILHILKMQNKKVKLLAPTGRAAKRLNESTGEDASTIHRALDLDFKNGNGVFFTKNEDDPLTEDVIIVDETSMVDCSLMYYLLKAIKPTAQLILVGDKDQLPSVGAGNVLSDILNSNVISTVQLTEIYRQDAKSYIITNAHLINNGKMPILDNSSSDFFYQSKIDQTEMLHTCVNLVTMRLPRFLNTDATKIQVLSPLKSGVCGVESLNRELQKMINPTKPNLPEIQTESTTYRIGDKVMQIVNNYEQTWKRQLETGGYEEGSGVFNGDIGTIYEINGDTGEITVMFEDGRLSSYAKTDIGQLVLSYAITIHKSQGCEFDAVVIPIVGGTGIIFTRNLLYTAVTRAKKMVVLIGTKFNIKRMVENNFIVKRNSMLKSFLIKEQNNFDLMISSK